MCACVRVCECVCAPVRMHFMNILFQIQPGLQAPGQAAQQQQYEARSPPLWGWAEPERHTLTALCSGAKGSTQQHQQLQYPEIRMNP